MISHPRSNRASIPDIPPSYSPSSHSSSSSFYPPYAFTGRVVHHTLPDDAILLHDGHSASKMRNAGNLARRLLDSIANHDVSRPGVSTETINDYLHEKILECGAYPSPLNYMNFPKSLCASVNEVVCHGIPDARSLRMGDVTSFDVSVYLDGVHGDNCSTIVVGDYDDDDDDDDIDGRGKGGDGSNTTTKTRNVKTKFVNDEEEERFVTARRLVEAARMSRDEGVRACVPGGCLSDVGAACHAVADAYG
jgi:methionyl aminopeptidase